MSYREREVWGGDTETIRMLDTDRGGLPYTVQLVGPSFKCCVPVTARTVTKVFIKLLAEKVPSGSVVYFHNLEFDLQFLFFPYRQAFAEGEKLRLFGEGFEVECLFGDLHHALIRLGSARWELVDTFAFFKMSLDDLGKVFKLGGKLPKPKGLGTKDYRGTPEWGSFVRYALRDAEVTKGVGEEIEKFHRLYDVRPSISTPQLAARILRHHYIPEGHAIPALPEELEEPSTLSYHGGKNGLYVPPGVYSGVNLYDIRSAYPWSMVNLPNVLDCRYKIVSRVRDFSRPGVYCISGDSRVDRYNPLRDHDFKPVYGRFACLWVTGYELSCLVRHRFVDDLTIHRAVVIDPASRRANPLANFCRTFYRKKEESTGGLREFYKVILNSLYGKFVACTKETDSRDGSVTFHAGSLWNPLIASLITGQVRAYLTDLEIESQALHSSTDGFLTTRPMKTGPFMGDLSLKATGDTLLLRPKLYLLWNEDRDVESFALHGFHGYLKSFVSMMRSGKRTYVHRRLRKPRESAKRRVPGQCFETFYKRINVPLSEPVKLPRLRYNGREL